MTTKTLVWTRWRNSWVEKNTPTRLDKSSSRTTPENTLARTSPERAGLNTKRNSRDMLTEGPLGKTPSGLRGSRDMLNEGTSRASPERHGINGIRNAREFVTESDIWMDLLGIQVSCFIRLFVCLRKNFGHRPNKYLGLKRKELYIYVTFLVSCYNCPETKLFWGKIGFAFLSFWRSDSVWISSKLYLLYATLDLYCTLHHFLPAWVMTPSCLLLPCRDMAERSLKRRKSSKQPTNQWPWAEVISMVNATFHAWVKFLP